MFFQKYIHLVYIILFVYFLQSVDRGNHLAINQMKATSGKQLNLIVIVQFIYIKMFCYYIVSVSILVLLGIFFYVFDAGFCEGHLPHSRCYQTGLKAKGKHWCHCTNLICTNSSVVLFFQEYICLVYIILSIFDAKWWSGEPPGCW